MFDLSGIQFSWKDKKKGIILPKYLSEDLAYLVGVHIGDGCMNIYKYSNQVDYFYEVTGHEINDRLFHKNILIPLFEKLFNIKTKIRQNSKGCIGLNIRSKAFVTFMNKCIGLPLGKKDTINIPNVILNSSLKIQLACLKGIFDTDFSLSFKKKTLISHSYPIMSLSSVSEDLIKSISKILKLIDISYSQFTELRNDSRFNVNTMQFLISISGKKNLEKWFKLIGSKNPSYLSRYAIYRKFGFCPPNTNYATRKKILLGQIDLQKFYS